MMNRISHLPHIIPALAVCLLAAASPQLLHAASDSGPDPRAREYAGWLAAMKEAPRGPFERIRWFCKDGTIQPPKAYACANHGGGIQHGEWTAQVKQMRSDGYYVANVLADIDAADFTGAQPDTQRLAQILIERFLIQADNGWVFRAAYSYRGALQAEDEEAGALALVTAMLGDNAWRSQARFLLMREAVRLLPIQTDDVSATAVRQLALDIAEKDDSFRNLRIKIHGSPEASDAAAVRAYAKSSGKKALAADYERMAVMIDDLYSERGAVDTLNTLAASASDPEIAKALRQYAGKLAAADSPAMRLREAGVGLYLLRLAFQGGSSPSDGLIQLKAGIALEREAYIAGNALRPTLPGSSRRAQLTHLANGLLAIYGGGLISKRELDSALGGLQGLDGASPLTLARYRTDLRYLARVPEWSAGQMHLNFIVAESRLAALDPLAHQYGQDRLRSSPLLIATAVLDNLERDSNRTAGIQHVLFGKRVGTGLRALNPGMTRGKLYSPGRGGSVSSVDSNGIYLLPETTSDLPRVAGILTQGEGNSLSHVQLLARNLGIPNVVVQTAILPQVRERLAKPIVLAVSPGGVVQLDDDGPAWDRVFGKQATKPGHDVVIKPDLEKLNLKVVDFVPLSKLRSADSGRVSGPKGANLGELKHHFGNRVPDGFVIPFGVFRALLDQPLERGGPSVYEWMKAEYKAIDSLKSDPAKQSTRVGNFLSRLRKWIASTNPGPAFHDRLRASLSKLGKDGTFGVFVRSDTNVEDLPGFTGAGLNQTIPNVVGFDKIALAVREVWASPFTERAYSWRQNNMTQPEYVFPAVVIQYSFPSEKSGVMVTTDLEGGGNDWLSVAVSEGVGGAVDGQAAEGLRIPTNGKPAQLLAQATAPYRRVLSSKGGTILLPASGTEYVLKDGEIEQLVSLAREVPKKIKELRDSKGNPIPADIEFGFKDGRISLLQIRPFVESKSAQRNQYLISLDEGFRASAKRKINLAEAPQGGSR